MPTWEAGIPLLAATASNPASTLPPAQGDLSVLRSGVIVTAFGTDLDSLGTLLQV